MSIAVAPESRGTDARTLASEFGDVAWLMTRSPVFRGLPLAILERLVMPPMLLRQ